jgi:glycosyltransferase involved in cell wall biosynthesis
MLHRLRCPNRILIGDLRERGMPRVSVIVPTYNSARFLGRALKSALAQTYDDREVFVVDDGSTDGTREVVARYGGKIQYLYQPNRGPAAARNLALSRAGGELIAYLDADDMWYPQKLEKQVAFLDGNKQYGLVHSEMDIIDEEDHIIHRRFNQTTGRDITQGFCAMRLLHRGHIQTVTVIVRREWVDRVGGFDERLKGNEDYLHWLLLAIGGAEFGYINEPLAMYRWTKESLSRSPQSHHEDLIRMLNILLEEKFLVRRLGPEAVEIVRHRLPGLGLELAYIERIEGRADLARRRLLGLIREWPMRAELYLELMKACIPPVVMKRLRILKARCLADVVFSN